jgi:hypothetical protein
MKTTSCPQMNIHPVGIRANATRYIPTGIHLSFRAEWHQDSAARDATSGRIRAFVVLQRDVDSVTWL